MLPFVSGGDIATLGQWPWIVSLSYLGRPFCSGTLIAEDWVVTAGHCVAMLVSVIDIYVFVWSTIIAKFILLQCFLIQESVI